MQKSWKPTAAGVLAIVGGALILLFAFIISLGMAVAAPFSAAIVSVALFSALYLGAGIVALIGGIYALQCRHWGLSLAGSICTLVPPATMLGIASIVFIAMAREEFSPVPLVQSSQTAESSPAEGKYDHTTDFGEPGEGERNA